MKKKKRAKSPLSVKRTRKHSSQAPSPIFWMVMIVIIGAIGWYFYRPSGTPSSMAGNESRLNPVNVKAEINISGTKGTLTTVTNNENLILKATLSGSGVQGPMITGYVWRVTADKNFDPTGNIKQIQKLSNLSNEKQFEVKPILKDPNRWGWFIATVSIDYSQYITPDIGGPDNNAIIKYSISGQKLYLVSPTNTPYQLSMTVGKNPMAERSFVNANISATGLSRGSTANILSTKWRNIRSAGATISSQKPTTATITAKPISRKAITGRMILIAESRVNIINSKSGVSTRTQYNGLSGKIVEVTANRAVNSVTIDPSFTTVLYSPASKTNAGGGMSQLFKVTAKDKYNNELTNAKYTWSPVLPSTVGAKAMKVIDPRFNRYEITDLELPAAQVPIDVKVTSGGSNKTITAVMGIVKMAK